MQPKTHPKTQPKTHPAAHPEARPETHQDGPGKYLGYHNRPRPLVAMENRWPAGSSTGWHTHPRGQLLYATEGVMVVHSDAGSWVVPPNRALWMVAHLRHNVTMSGDVLMRTAYVDETAIKRLPKESCVINVSPLLRELLVEAVRLPPEGALSPRDKRLIALLIDELRVANTLALHLPMPSDERLQTICQALIARPDDATSAAAWAATINVGERTLQRLFTQHTGMGFSQWREQARLLAALTAIAQGKKLIEVALDCGYSSHSAFTAMFKRHFGVPPSAFYGFIEDFRDPSRVPSYAEVCNDRLLEGICSIARLCRHWGAGRAINWSGCSGLRAMSARCRCT